MKKYLNFIFVVVILFLSLTAYSSQLEQKFLDDDQNAPQKSLQDNTNISDNQDMQSFRIKNRLEENEVCVQRVAYAVNIKGQCKQFSTPCDIPFGWVEVNSCDDANVQVVDREKIKERIKEIVEEKVEEIKTNRQNIKEKIKERTDFFKEAKNLTKDINSETVFSLSLGESKDFNGFSLKLEDVYSDCNDENCFEGKAVAILSVLKDEGVFDTLVLENNRREFFGTLALKLLNVKEETAKIQVLPIKRGFLIGSESSAIRVSINSEKILEEDDSNTLNEISDLNIRNIKRIKMKAGRGDYLVELEDGARPFLHKLRQTHMQQILAKLKYKDMFFDLNITKDEDGQIIIKTPRGDIIIDKEIELDENSLYIIMPKQKKRLAVLPQDASEIAKLRANFYKVDIIKLDTNSDEPVYKIKGMQRGKIFGIFSTDYDVEGTLDIETGEIKNTKKPWWTIFVFGVEKQDSQ
ncbi:MAG: hypothetical protein N3D73_01730 [Candidatus Diapherotrites archaeon]|nr:hypothetical protein [Candidatus Diapherotrites archaeon]